MPDHLLFSWFLGDDGRPWVEHICGEDRIEVWRPPNPPWHLTTDGGVAPSFSCERCGAHTILGSADRCDVPEGAHRCVTGRNGGPYGHPAEPAANGSEGPVSS